MKRLHFLTSSAESAQELIVRLRAQGVESEDIHIVAKQDHMGEYLQVEEMTIEETSDVSQSRNRGTIAGASTGLLAGLGVVLLPGGLLVGAGMLAAAGLIGAGFGMAVSTIIGGSEEHPIYAEYEERINAGEILMAVDVSEEDLQAVLNNLKSYDPDLTIKERTMTDVQKVRRSD